MDPRIHSSTHPLIPHTTQCIHAIRIHAIRIHAIRIHSSTQPCNASAQIDQKMGGGSRDGYIFSWAPPRAYHATHPPPHNHATTHPCMPSTRARVHAPTHPRIQQPRIHASKGSSLSCPHRGTKNEFMAMAAVTAMTMAIAVMKMSSEGQNHCTAIPVLW